MKYFLRSIKYLVKIVVLLGLIFWLMQMSGTSAIRVEGSAVDFLHNFFATSRGRIFSLALLVWCAVYPSVEFRRRNLFYDIAARREAIIKAFAAGRMRLAGEEEGRMVFRGESLVRTIWWLGDEAVTVTRSADGGIDIEGPRRFVMEAEHRIPNYVGAGNGNENE
ncbi:MAG: hypothetical protein LBU98_04985 [Alistipes sp.]|jgi:hypothetical protein|nr:hypothetical protein [Alistipes sp.]